MRWTIFSFVDNQSIHRHFTDYWYRLLPISFGNVLFRPTAMILNCFLLLTKHVSLWKPPFTIVSCFFVVFFLIENPGFPFDIIRSNTHFSTNIELSAVYWDRTQQFILAEDDYGIYSDVEFVFHCQKALWKVYDEFLDGCDDKECTFSDDWLVVGCCFFDFLGNSRSKMMDVLIVWLGSFWWLRLCCYHCRCQVFCMTYHQQSSCLHHIQKHWTTINHGKW